ncbi:MAG: NAD(P)H-hydrate dehydratase [Rubricoccaceae bacterium]
MTDLLPLLSSDGMRAVDAATMGDWGIPGRVLMETAGRAAADAISARYPVAGSHVMVLAGTGNNGGDALVVARVLWSRGATVQVVALPTDATEGDRAANVALLTRLAASSDRLAFTERLVEVDLVIDGLLGIGATGDLREPVQSLCAWANRQPAPVVSLDIPSGLDATTGAAPDDAIRADLTVTMGALKTGLVLRDGPEHAGELVTVEMGFPPSEVREHASAWRATSAWVGRHLPRRAHDAHKYSAGRAACVVGSRRYTGAAVLSTRAAYRAGAGAVVACTPRSVRAVLDAQNLEVMVRAYAETERGTLALESRDRIAKHLRDADAALIGCGLDSADPTRALVRDLVRHAPCPVVLDADGLGAFAGHADTLRERTHPVLLTPHLGEYRRLIGDDDFTPVDRIETVREAAARWNANVLLKGMPSVLGTPGGRVFVGPPGRPALATAGTGDVLAGTLVGLAAQGVSLEDAAVCGMHLGAAAVDVWAADHGLAPELATGLMASDVVEALPRAAATFASS